MIYLKKIEKNMQIEVIEIKILEDILYLKKSKKIRKKRLKQNGKK